jgi:acyl carrier protein
MEFEKIQAIIAEQLSKDISEITLETNLSDDLGADSLDLFSIISEIEGVFDIEFSQDAGDKIKTVGDAVDYIQSILQ